MSDPTPSTVARPSVPARRARWSECNRSVARRLFAALTPVVLLGSFGAYCWYAYLGFMEHPTQGGALGMLVVLSLAVVAFGGLYSARGWWYSPCPLCGHEAARDFRNDQAAECGCCLAYLRADVDAERVLEESDDVVEFAASYTVRPADLGGRKQLDFPNTCGICGAPAKSFKPIKTFRLTAPEPTPASPQAPRRHLTADEQLWGPAAPVCEAHLQSDPVEIFQGELQFRSYAHFKAFCRLNGVERRAKG
ncbi:MAG: hypothetical protein QM765_08865 [Myxococcales bacterium]